MYLDAGYQNMIYNKEILPFNSCSCGKVLAGESQCSCGAVMVKVKPSFEYNGWSFHDAIVHDGDIPNVRVIIKVIK